MAHSDTADAIDTIVGIEAGSPVAQVRALRPEAAQYAQGSYVALLEPADDGGVSRVERALIALRAATLAPSREVAAHYRERLRTLGADEALVTAVERFPDGGTLSARLTAVVQHSDMLTLAPHTANRAALAALHDAGLSTRNIVSIAQLITFVSFQVRLAAGLRLLKEDSR